MKLIVGLGNPGKKYENTRHNIGFRVIEELSRRWQIGLNRRRFSGFAGDGNARGERVLLLAPTTYMNLSGRSVREAVTFYKLVLADLLVVVDDLALPLGRLRIRSKGSGGGHNGLTNVIDELGGDEFSRLRIGIGNVEGSDAVRYVLGPFSGQEKTLMDQAIPRAADAVECWLMEGVEAAMNKFNRPEE